MGRDSADLWPLFLPPCRYCDLNLRIQNAEKEKPPEDKPEQLQKEETDDWWEAKSKEEKQAYIKEHPGSKYAKRSGN